MRSSCSIAALCLFAGLGGCDPNISGRFSALRTGDISDVTVPRGAFDAAFRAACGDADPPTSAMLNRQPYLQRTNADSVQILWTGAEQDAYAVRVTRPDGASVTSVDSVVDDEAKPKDAHQHVAAISGLEPDQLYCYTIESGTAGPMTARTGFRTAPPPGSEAPVSFVAFGDSGYGGRDQKAVFEQLRDVRFDLAVHTGDVAYDHGTLQQFETSFFEIYEPILGSIPTFPIAGNHDYHTNAGAPFREVFSLPDNGGPDGKERWYSFDWGEVHFVALDTMQVGDTQATWLAADLERNTRPWVIVYTHDGPYSSGAHGSNHEFRDVFGKILRAHRVPLVLSGHDHHYERSKPIDGIVYIVTGGGGRGVRAPDRASWTAFSHDVLHFLHVTIDGPDLHLAAIDATGEVFDTVHIARPSDASP